MANGSILLVDDDVELLKALTKVLEKEGYEVTPRANANEALQHIESTKKHFDLVISDISMPGMRGTTFLSVLRTAFPKLPVIIITAFGDWDQYAAALREGAFEFMNKPLDKTRLLLTVRRAVSSSTAATQNSM
jgi:two-component system, NtrC family, nitrogen regulation response regulator GlnG